MNAPVAVRIHDEIPLPASADAEICGHARREDSYPVVVTRTTEATVQALLGLLDGRRAAIITDEVVAGLHAGDLVAGVRDAGIEAIVTAVPPGERSKSIETATSLLDWLAHSCIARRDRILAVGGGVINDTVGWVASAYMRGVPYINVPTTLLAQVDAALGGKVAVDHRTGKNLIGAFYQPVGVVSNVGYLETLDRRQMSAGLAEAIKKGIIASPALFEFIEAHADALMGGDLERLDELVRSASAVKCALIERDPYEEDLRRPLNFGHEIGHAVETVTGYGPVLHGEGVAFGMMVAARIGLRRGWTEHGLVRRMVALLDRLGLPSTMTHLRATVDPHDVVRALDKIRQIRDGRLRFVVPIALGDTAIVDDVSDEEIVAALVAGRG